MEQQEHEQAICTFCFRQLELANGYACFHCENRPLAVGRRLYGRYHHDQQKKATAATVSRQFFCEGLSEHPDYQTWIDKGQHYFSSAICYATKPKPVQKFYWVGPYVVDRNIDIAVQRMLSVPAPLRRWCTTIKATGPVSLFLDLEHYESDLHVANYLTFVTLEWLSEILNTNWSGWNVRVSDWWVFQADRKTLSESEQQSSVQKVKRSRRAYLPSFQFANIFELSQFMNHLKMNLKQKFVQNQFADGDFREKLIVYRGENESKRGEFRPYIDFGVYHVERQIRLPLCCKENISSQFSLMQVGEIHWCRELLRSVPFSLSPITVRTFSRFIRLWHSNFNVHCSQSYSSALGKRKDLLREEEEKKLNRQLFGQFLGRVSALQQHQPPVPLLVQLYSGIITYGAGLNPTISPFHLRYFQTCNDFDLKQQEAAQNQKTPQKPIKKTKVRRQQHDRGSGSSTSITAETTSSSSRSSSPPPPPSISLPPELLKLAQSIVVEYGDTTSCLIPKLPRKSSKWRSGDEKTIFIEIRSYSKPRICPILKTSTHSVGRNGGFLLVRWNAKYSNPEMPWLPGPGSWGSMQYRCWSESCKGKVGPTLQWYLPPPPSPPSIIT